MGNVNGYVLENNYDYPDNDISFQSTQTPDQCASLCDANVKCLGFTTDNLGKQCWLKGSLKGKHGNNLKNTYRKKITLNTKSVLPEATLVIGQKLFTGKSLYSDNKQYYLTLQKDGNLCIYNVTNNSSLWCTQTNNKNSTYLIMKSDGNLCIEFEHHIGIKTLNKSIDSIWCSNSNGKYGVYASIDNDGVLRIWNKNNIPVWESPNVITSIIPGAVTVPAPTPIVPAPTPIVPAPTPIVQVDYTYNNSTVPIYVIGNYGIAPWGSINFPDKTAQWIWYTPMANTNAPSNTEPITIQYIYSNTTDIPINGILNIMIDNSCDIYLNSNKIAENINGGWWDKWSKINFTAESGTNLFEFKVRNEGGPAGLLVYAGSGTDNLLFHTDNTWKFIPEKINQISTCTLSQIGLVNTTDKYFPWGCLTLNSSPSQYIDIGTTATSMNGLTFGCWFRSNNNSNWARIFDLGNGPYSDNIVLGIYGGKIASSVYITNMPDDKLDLTIDINNDKWNHIVWTLSKPISNSSNWIIYLNGQMVYSKLGNYPINMIRKNCYIGKSNWPSDPYFNGAISNFVMYQTELSGIKVNALYNNLINSNDPTLYLYLPLAINSVLDTIINNYPGKQFNLPITQSKIKSENWNCLQEGQKWIPVKMSNKQSQCMSLDGNTCLSSDQETCNSRIINPVTPANSITCSSNQTGWCSDAENMFSSNSQVAAMRVEMENGLGLILSDVKPGTQSLSALDISSEGETLNLKPLAGGGKVLSITNINDVNNLLIGGVFKLRVNLPTMPPYIKGKNFNIQTGVNPNYFYLSVEKLDNNCSVKAANGSCMNVYADEKKCSIKALTSHIQNNSYRLVLISSQYVLDPSIPIGKNSDFTLVQINGQTYLKNIQTGYLPSLYFNDSNILVHGDMNINSNTNINKVDNLITNTICGQEVPKNQTSGTKYLKCNIEQDPGTYLMTTNNIGESSPVRVNINNDKTISMNLLSFNSYGFPTKIYSLIFCNFNVKTFSYIEKITNTLGTFLVNMVCFSDVQNSKLTTSNQLKFTVELISFPPNFVKDNSVFTI